MLLQNSSYLCAVSFKMKRCMQNFAPKFLLRQHSSPRDSRTRIGILSNVVLFDIKRAQFVPKKTFLKQCENTRKRDDLCTLNMSVELFYEFFRGDNVKLRSWVLSCKYFLDYNMTSRRSLRPKSCSHQPKNWFVGLLCEKWLSTILTDFCSLFFFEKGHHSLALKLGSECELRPLLAVKKKKTPKTAWVL